MCYRWAGVHDILGCSVKQSFASFFVDPINSCKTTYSKLCFELHLAKMDKMSCIRVSQNAELIQVLVDFTHLHT